VAVKMQRECGILINIKDDSNKADIKIRARINCFSSISNAWSYVTEFPTINIIVLPYIIICYLFSKKSCNILLGAFPSRFTSAVEYVREAKRKEEKNAYLILAQAMKEEFLCFG
jgi:hypothetical protein